MVIFALTVLYAQLSSHLALLCIVVSSHNSSHSFYRIFFSNINLAAFAVLPYFCFPAFYLCLVHDLLLIFLLGFCAIFYQFTGFNHFMLAFFFYFTRLIKIHDYLYKYCFFCLSIFLNFLCFLFSFWSHSYWASKILMNYTINAIFSPILIKEYQH